MQDSSGKIAAILKDLGSGYQLVRLLGQGSIGTVYECLDSQKQHVAVKLMEANPMVESAVFSSIIQAAVATVKIPDSVNVVKVLYAGTQHPFYYIVMDMMEGGTLETIVGNSSFSLSAKLRIAEEIAQTLAAIHKRGIVHGDLKPANILISDDNKPYLTDFYLFPARGAGAMPSMPLGTPYYMSPEQAKGAFITTASDIYSFGIMIYELLTGSMPYALKPNNIQEMVHEIMEGSINSPHKTNPEINFKLEAVIMKLLVKNPDRRYRNMTVAADDISACINNSPISIPFRKTFLEKISSLFSQKNRS